MDPAKNNDDQRLNSYFDQSVFLVGNWAFGNASRFSPIAAPNSQYGLPCSHFKLRVLDTQIRAGLNFFNHPTWASQLA
jgi:hypothetical protein